MQPGNVHLWYFKTINTAKPNSQNLKNQKFMQRKKNAKIRVENNRAENFRMVDIEIYAWSSLFANLKTNLVFRLIRN